MSTYLCFFSGLLLQISCGAREASSNGITCSPWSKFDPLKGSCICPDSVQGLLYCDDSGYINAVQSCSCTTYDSAKNVTEVGNCIYGCSKTVRPDYRVPSGYTSLSSNISQWNEEFCGPFRREGTLCGACQKGHYAPAYSYEMKCLECDNGRKNLWKYLLWAFGPLTLFYFILLLQPVNIISSRLLGFVFHNQMLAVPMLARVLLINKGKTTYVPYIAKFIGTFYGMWNLDFFRTYNSGICLQTETLTTLTLDLAIATYPLFLMMITYLMIIMYDNNFRPLVILMKPILNVLAMYKTNWNIRTSMIDFFVTFSLLSNVKILSLCIDLLTPVTVYQFNTLPNVSSSRRLYYDSSMEYFGSKHLPYAVLAIVVLSTFVLLPILLLTLNPLRAVQRCINFLPSRVQLFLKTFVDSFQGCYKDGTEPGTRDYRYLSALHFLIRLVLIVIYMGTLDVMFPVLAAMVLVLAAICFIVIDPFRRDLQHISINWQMHLLFLACFGACFTSVDTAQLYEVHNFYSAIFVAVAAASSLLPVIYFSSFIAYSIFVHTKFLTFFKRKDRA